MQQVWFLIICLLSSLVYATVQNVDNDPAATLRHAGRLFATIVLVLLAIAWFIYFISPN